MSTYLGESIALDIPREQKGFTAAPLASQIEAKPQKAEERWKTEIKKSASRYHLIGAWVGFAFNLVFSAADYVNFPHLWADFFQVRLAVSLITLLGIILHKRQNWSVEWVIYIPFVLICIENAYMWSYMDAEFIQKHTLSYIAVFIGAGMLVVWDVRFSISIFVVSLIANLYFLNVNSQVDVTTLLSAGGILTLSVAIFSILLIQTRYNLNKKATIARLALEESNKELVIQKDLVEEKSQDIIESIEYAQNIQEAILPNQEAIGEVFKDHFVLYLPKDIVSGDFYWFKHFGDVSILAAVDCTGHGVPGAFMSMIGNTLMNKVISDERNFDPGTILNTLRKEVIDSLKQGNGKSSDSMDMALIAVNHETGTISFAGANNPLILVRDKDVQIIKGDKMPIGTHYVLENEPFTTHTMEFQEGDCVYLISDGFPDQFGGARDKKYSMRRFRDLLLQVNHAPMERQLEILNKSFNEWKGTQSQIDDVLVIGVRF